MGFGCAYLAGGFETRTNTRLVDAAFDAGIRHFDVAPLYGQGTAEDVLGRSLHGKRNNVTIASKAGIQRPEYKPMRSFVRASTVPLRHLIRRFHKPRDVRATTRTNPVTDFSPSFVDNSLNESLRRLKTDYLDLFLLHEARVTDLTDEIVSLLQKRRKDGSIRALGVASDVQSTIEILETYPSVFSVHQFAWSALDFANAPLPNACFTITHRSLLRAYAPVQKWLARDPAARRRLENEVGLSLVEANVLPRLLIGSAVGSNPNGIVLIASRQRDRVVENAGISQDEFVIAAGMRLAAALGREPLCPLPIE